MNKKHILFLIIILFASAKLFAQGGSVSGNFQMNMQTYSKDTIIGAEKTPEKMLLNSYANINYINGNFKAGVRYEGYFNQNLRRQKYWIRQRNGRSASEGKHI